MKRPYVICHMMSSVSGRIKTDRWNLGTGIKEYEKVHEKYNADAWMCGRITMEAFAGKTKIGKTRFIERIPRTDFVAPHRAKSFAISLDASGKIAWTKNNISGDHIINVITEKVSEAYLAHLRTKKVSYIFGGQREIDFKHVLEKLTKLFGIKRVLLEGGGGINGSMLKAGMIDELSLLVAPVADAEIGLPTVFDVTPRSGKTPSIELKLFGIEKRAAGVVWLRYRVDSRK